MFKKKILSKYFAIHKIIKVNRVFPISNVNQTMLKIKLN